MTVRTVACSEFKLLTFVCKEPVVVETVQTKKQKWLPEWAGPPTRSWAAKSCCSGDSGFVSLSNNSPGLSNNKHHSVSASGSSWSSQPPRPCCSGAWPFLLQPIAPEQTCGGTLNSLFEWKRLHSQFFLYSLFCCCLCFLTAKFWLWPS